jgi:hypothetical protein
MRHLAAFFKHPLGVKEMDFQRQFDMLVAYANAHLAGGTDSAEVPCG